MRMGVSEIVTVPAVANAQAAWQGPRWEVAAGCSMLKGGRADWLVEKCTELGAFSLVPLISERVHGAGGAASVCVSCAALQTE